MEKKRNLPVLAGPPEAHRVLHVPPGHRPQVRNHVVVVLSATARTLT